MTLSGDPLSPIDLRLGNIVLGPDQKPTRIEYLSAKFHPSILGKPGSISNKMISRQGIEGFHGLPIDAKWLSKLGFEKVEDHWRIGIDEIILIKKSETTFGFDRIPALELRFVHQLQNLMFAIRGFEDLIPL